MSRPACRQVGQLIRLTSAHQIYDSNLILMPSWNFGLIDWLNLKTCEISRYLTGLELNEV